MADRGSPLAARIRAAMGYRDIDRAGLAREFGVSRETVSAWRAGETVPDLKRLAAFCRVPEWFFDHGFDVPVELDDPTLVERIEALEHRNRTVMTLIASVAGAAAVEEALRREQDEGVEGGGA